LKVLKTVEALHSYLDSIKNLKLGFVPTMGALHQGHISLLKIAKQQNEAVLCSIFVNPLQFNNPEDLKKYPRNEALDFKLLEENNCDAVFNPSYEDLFANYQVKQFDLGMLDKVMEGKFRPGHFNGVANVVFHFFQLIKPRKAYFGEKDFQQLAVIKHIVSTENLDIEIIPCPTFREKSGLAMSSRNLRLTADEQENALFISKTLFKAKTLKDKKLPSEIIEICTNDFNENKNLKLEYFEIVEENTLETPIEWNESLKFRACVAAFSGEIRLIDNVQL